MSEIPNRPSDQAALDSRSLTALENDITATRDRLARSIDELTERVRPENLVGSQVARAKQGFYNVTHDERGEVRTERLAITGAVVVGLIVLKVVIGRRR